MDIISPASQCPCEDMVGQWVYCLAQCRCRCSGNIPYIYSLGHLLTHWVTAPFHHHQALCPHTHIHTQPCFSEWCSLWKSSKVIPVQLMTSKIKMNNSHVFKWELGVLFHFRFHLKITNYKIVVGKWSCYEYLQSLPTINKDKSCLFLSHWSENKQDTEEGAGEPI